MDLNAILGKLASREFGLCAVGVFIGWRLIEAGAVKYGVILSGVSLGCYTVGRSVQKVFESKKPDATE